MSKTSQRKRTASQRRKAAFEAGKYGLDFPFPSYTKKELQKWRNGYDEFWGRSKAVQP